MPGWPIDAGKWMLLLYRVNLALNCHIEIKGTRFAAFFDV